MSSTSVKDELIKSVGFLPKDAISWLYAARGYYKMKQYSHVIEAVQHCLRNEQTLREGQHLLAFSLLHTGQHELAALEFRKSILLGNDTDWQVLVGLCLSDDSIKLGALKNRRV